MTTLGVVIASTRPGRMGLPVGRWATEAARAHGAFQVEVLDLAEIALPMLDEPHHPRLATYVHEHTHRWSASVEAADAFVFVTPEYNHGPAPSLLNAISYLYREWLHKPVGFVSYGGASGGMRGVEAIKPVLSRLSMVALNETVAVSMIRKHVADEVFSPSESQQTAAVSMLDSLVRWTGALQTLRAGKQPDQTSGRLSKETP